MALYMVKAGPRKELLQNLQKDLSSGNISKMRPFGHAIQHSLENARIDNENPDRYYGRGRLLLPTIGYGKRKCA